MAFRFRPGRQVCGISVAAAVAIALAVKHRREVLTEEHRVRKHAAFEAQNEVSRLTAMQWKQETTFMKAGASQAQATALTLTDDFLQVRRHAEAELQRAKAALDAFYLKHPEYRNRL